MDNRTEMLRKIRLLELAGIVQVRVNVNSHDPAAKVELGWSNARRPPGDISRQSVDWNRSGSLQGSIVEESKAMKREWRLVNTYRQETELGFFLLISYALKCMLKMML